MHWVILAFLVQQDPTYPDLSRKQGLGAADQLMRDGKYLEAAVAYRNVLLMPGDREAVRIPLALALLAKGDAVYAGIEVRRAHMLYPEFAKLAIDPAELFGSKETLSKAADAAAVKEKDGDGAEVSAAAAYAYYLVGDRDRAQASLAKYVQTRGNDAFVRDLSAALGKLPVAKAPVVAVPPPPPPANAPPPVRGGDPERAGVRYVELPTRPRGEILAR
jgi:thioredoxin-like negative regulator of GroEL